MPTWEFSYLYSHSSTKPALAHTISKRRGQQLRAACQELASAETPAFPVQHAFRLPEGEPDERSRDRSGYGEEDQKEMARRAFTQRTIRRKKSSFDLRDLFLSGEMSSSLGSSRTASEA
ncbi:hypothetical protein BN946_scf185008.g89 [Trametes cinnabarina]|uniref:Uncharacterized protein n=1 Tax=Pycnoporus cinnabarinus TaxID=5643 RepID=A0A060SGN4_PYCCI|nr:hypothetical protein BN946_scf185008.g89 [Trametes cinnabarina]